MTNAGEYVFLLEKGRDYNFGTRPFLHDVTYAAVDDIDAAVFEGVLSDAGANLDVSYEWRTSHDNLEIAAPNERKTEVSPKAGTDSGVYDLSVTATLGQHKLTSTITGQFYTNEESVVKASLSISAPKVLLLESNAVQGQAEGTVKIDLQLPEDESGSLSLECVSGADKIQLSGETTWQVECSTTKEVRITGTDYSCTKDDVKLIASFTSVKGETTMQEVPLTVIKIWHEAVSRGIYDSMRSRFAVAESFVFLWYPLNIKVAISCNSDVEMKKGNGWCRVVLPLHAGFVTMSFNMDGLPVQSILEVLEPQMVQAIQYKEDFLIHAGAAGGIRVEFKVQVLPADVPFSGLNIREVPQIATDATGYFAQPQYADYLNHGLHGAGAWVPLNDYNCINDTASMPVLAQPWLEGGSFSWPIPCAWQFKYEEDTTERVFTHYTQRFELDADGTTRLKKFGYCAERTTNNVSKVIGGS